MKATACPQEFWSQVDAVGVCWEWTGRRNRYDYGQFGRRYAHRVAWEYLIEPISPGLTLDHLCINPCCVNPDHLELVTQSENSRRAIARRHGGADLCIRGHDLNIHGRIYGGKRKCLTCLREKGRERRRAKRRNQDGEFACLLCEARFGTSTGRALHMWRLHGERYPECPKGHELSPANVYLRRNGAHECRACHREQSARQQRAAT